MYRSKKTKMNYNRKSRPRRRSTSLHEHFKFSRLLIKPRFYEIMPCSRKVLLDIEGPLEDIALNHPLYTYVTIILKQPIAFCLISRLF